MATATDLQIQVGDQVFTRTRVTARLRLATEENTPPHIWHSGKATEDKVKLWLQDTTSPDLCHVSFVLDVEGANNNWDYMPRPQLVAGHGTAKWKPVDMDHVVKEQASMLHMSKEAPPVKNTIYGVMTHAALAHSDGTLLTAKEINALDQTDDWRRETKDKVAVVAWASLWNFLFPQTVATLVKEIDDGTIAVSMERWIKQYDFMVWNSASNDYDAVPLEDAQTSGIRDRWAKHQATNGKPIYRRALQFIYGGAASTHNPAQPLAQFVAPGYVKAAASGKSDPALRILLTRHGEVHQQFVVSTSEEQCDSLISEHERITRAIAALLGR